MLMRSLFLRLATNKTAERFVKSNPISQKMTARFVAGETLQNAIEAVKALNSNGIAATIDLLGESVLDRTDVESTVSIYLQLIKGVRENSLKTTLSVKLTALGLDIDSDLCKQSMIRLLDAASPEVFIQIDMEGTPHTERTLELFHLLRANYENVGAVIQAYLYRSREDVERLTAAHARVRLCKGAYKEPITLAHQAKPEVDKNYLALMQPLLEKGDFPGFATHDAKIIQSIKEYALSHNIDKSRFEFQMLYGIRRDLQDQLVREGYNLTVYVPFGKQWYPYFMRRLAERPANLWLLLKSFGKG